MHTVPTVFESRVIQAPLDKVWKSIRNLEFPFWKLVDNVDLQKNESGVGNSRKVQFKDGTVQEFRVLELSDYNYTVIYELEDSNPSVQFLSVIHTIRCKHVTHDNSTFIEWSSLFSSDADQQVIQDNQFKKQDALKDLAEFIKN
ncbi:Bet v1-like protein [Neoconidiobolus thromboides FSU 785]|nr:Bet v1-like protein [Neoconidiobolus thromboides FSU 785]